MPPLLELPETPFLGFGTSGLSMSSPVKLNQQMHTPNRNTRTSCHHTAPTRSTTYYTWSRSGTLSTDSLPVHPASETRQSSGLQHKCQLKRQLVSQTPPNQDLQMKYSPRKFEIPGHPENTVLGLEMPARELLTECRSGHALQTGGMRGESKESPHEKGLINLGKSSRELQIQQDSMTESPKTPLAAKAPFQGIGTPSMTNDPHLDPAVPLRTVDAALDRLARQCTESPSWQTGNSLLTTVVPFGVGSKEAGSLDNGSLNQNPPRGNDKLRLRIRHQDPDSGNFTSGIGSSSMHLSTPMKLAPQILHNHIGTSLQPSSSVSVLGRSPRRYGMGAHQVPLLRTSGIAGSEMPAKTAWHGYDNLYERQDTPRYNFSSGNIDFARRYTPIGNLWSGGFAAPKDRLSTPYRSFDPYRHRKEMEFQHPEEKRSRPSNPFNERHEKLRGSNDPSNNSPIKRLFANGGDLSCRQFNKTFLQKDRYAVDGDTASRVGQKHSPGPHTPEARDLDDAEHCTSEQLQNYPRQAYSRYEPSKGETPRLRDHTTPYSARFLHELAGTPGQVRLNLEEDHFAGFWKPHLLY